MHQQFCNKTENKNITNVRACVLCTYAISFCILKVQKANNVGNMPDADVNHDLLVHCLLLFYCLLYYVFV